MSLLSIAGIAGEVAKNKSYEEIYGKNRISKYIDY